MTGHRTLRDTSEKELAGTFYQLKRNYETFLLNRKYEMADFASWILTKPVDDKEFETVLKEVARTWKRKQ